MAPTAPSEPQSLRALFNRLPTRLFDIHAHLYRPGDLAPIIPGRTDRPDAAGLPEWRERIGRQTGGVPTLAGGLFFPLPSAGRKQVEACNRFLADQLDGEASSRGLVLVPPDMNRETAAAWLASERIVGFKVYHTLADRENTYDDPFERYCPGWAGELLDKAGGILMLHLVRDGALADGQNQAQVRAFCEAWPGAKVILAHAGRSFHGPNARAGLDAYRGLENLWFDTSAICESEPLVEILEAFGPHRLLWGTDFPISETWGRCVTYGEGFAWVYADELGPAASPNLRPWRVGCENLRALFEAFDRWNASREEIAAVFADNALALLGLETQQTDRTERLYEHARERIPGGVQLLSKRPEMLAPGSWPAYYREARGCETWDLDGRHYYDFSINGIGSCLLGLRDPDVTAAVRRVISQGAMASLNPPEEVELADLLCEIHPWADCARFARTGGEVAAVAVRIARATTDRSKIAIGGYHGWADWYLAANLGESDALRGHLLPGLEPLGVPRELRGTTLPFRHGDLEAFDRILEEHGDDLAAVVMEPCRHADPEEGFLEHIRKACDRVGAILIFDEITIGWRRIHGGAHLLYGVDPDMAIFAKSLGNGHPIAAVIGRREAMEGAHRSFISSTYWTERVGPAAAIAALTKMQASDVVSHVERIGGGIVSVLREAAARHGLPLTLKGFNAAPQFAFDHDDAQALKTLYTQEMLDRGFLAGPLVFVTLAHREAHVALFAEAVDKVFGRLAEAVAEGAIRQRLRGEVAHTGFRRLL
jgi:glutamate-1-semialdehyde 2,1-aminomutase